MTRDRELWGWAAHILRTHGEEATAFVADRVAVLAPSDDEAGVTTWRQIADRIGALRNRAEGASH